MEFQVFAPQTMVTARNRDRSVFSAWGLVGGEAGAVSRFAKNPDGPDTVELGSTDVVLCGPGDVLLIGHGEGRKSFEAVWTRARYDVLTRLLTEVPVTWRFFVKHRIFTALKGKIAPQDVGARDVVRAYVTLLESFADLPPPPADLVSEHAEAAE